MELKVYKDTLSTTQTICDAKTELPVEAELLLPDYLPQVFKIVKCFVYLVVLQKQFSAARLTVEGYLRLAVWYQAEEDETLCVTEQKLPFTKQFDLQTGEYAGADASVYGETEYLNCRAVNPRRIDVRGAFALTVQARAQVMQEMLTALSGAGAEQKLTPVRGMRVLAVQEKLITADESIHFEAPPEMVLDCALCGDVQEVRFVSGKAMLKGTLQAVVTYRSGPGYLVQQAEKEIPFNEIMDVDGADESCHGLAFVEPVGCAIVNSEESGPGASVTALLHLKVYRENETMAVADAFSTEYEMELVPREVTLERESERIDKEIEVVTSGPLPDADTRVVTAKAFATQPELVPDGGGAALRGRVFFHVMCASALGEMNCYDKTAEYTLPLPTGVDAEHLLVETRASVTSVSARRSGTDTSAAVMVRVHGMVCTRTTGTVLENAVCTDLRVHTDDAALRIYYAQAGEDLFDIAKRYGASPDTIAAANGIAREDAVAKTQLLIPTLV